MQSNDKQNTLLIVDDTPTNLDVLFAYLQETGFKVLLARDGETALKQATYTKPDLILLDIMMPGIDGVEVCRRLKTANKTKDIPIILITAYNDKKNRIEGFKLGAADYITKPLHHEEVLARIKYHLAHHNLQKDLKEEQLRLEQESGRRRWILDALKESRERYRLLAEHSTDMIARQTLDGVYRYVSPACYTLLGYKIEDMIGHSILEFVHPDDLFLVEEAIKNNFDNSSTFTITYRVCHHNNNYIWLETTSKIIYNRETEVAEEIIAISRDITDRKKAEVALQKAHDDLEERVLKRTLELEQANKLLKKEIVERKQAEAEIQAYSEELKTKNEILSHLDKLKDEFLNSTSQELHMPLGSIIGIAQSMIDGATGTLTPIQQQNLSMIVSTGNKLTHLVNNILDFSKLKHQTLNLKPGMVNIHTIVEVVLILCKPLIGNKPLKLINKVPSNVVSVYADEERIKQVIQNLINNAIKFTNQGSVTISAYAENDWLVTTVADTGIGISEDKVDVIFQSSAQKADATPDSYEGSGLGLTITKQLVELHGGRIFVESIPEQGSCFSFTLPIYHGLPDEKKKDNSFIPPTQIGSFETNLVPSVNISSEELEANQNLTILVIDDEAINLQLLSNYLSLHNYLVSTAVDGQEALELLEVMTPDLILLDIMIPKVSGYEVCQEVRKHYPPYKLPIILLTTHSKPTDLVVGFNAGANDYLTKPVDKNELLARVKIHLNLAKVSAAYGRFVPHEFLQFLEKDSIIDVNLGDQVHRKMTVLFSDIRSFTTLSEEMTPQENFNFLNSYLKRVSPAIRKHGGFIDKYMGDSIMALFPEEAENALRAAIAMGKSVSEYNEHRKTQGYRDIRIGIGIHTGNLILGTVGEDQRMESTVISDAVNLAARMEGLTKLYGVTIVISETTLFSLDRPNRYHFRFLDRVTVKGKTEPISVFEIFNSDPEETIDRKLKTRTDFERGLLHYHSEEFDKAIEFFNQVLEQDESDKAAKLYLNRATRFEKFGVPDDWEGVETLTEK